MKNRNFTRLSGGRNIPIFVTLTVLFSDVLSIIGLVFFLMGSIFVLVFGSLSDWSSFSFDENSPTVTGYVNDIGETGASINDEYVLEYFYTYKLLDGSEYEGVSYMEGDSGIELGSEVQVEYVKDNPEISRIQGMRNSEFGVLVVVLVGIFPLIGLILFYFGFSKSLKHLRILKIGEIAYGKYLYREATNVSVNERTVFKLTFEFTARNGRTYKAIAKTHQPERLQDEEEEMLVYDPNKPEAAVLLDSLPKRIKKYFLKDA